MIIAERCRFVASIRIFFSNSPICTDRLTTWVPGKTKFKSELFRVTDKRGFGIYEGGIFFIKANVVGPHENCLCEAILMRTHSICFKELPQWLSFKRISSTYVFFKDFLMWLHTSLIYAHGSLTCINGWSSASWTTIRFSLPILSWSESLQLWSMWNF